MHMRKRKYKIEVPKQKIEVEAEDRESAKLQGLHRIADRLRERAILKNYNGTTSRLVATQ